MRERLDWSYKTQNSRYIVHFPSTNLSLNDHLLHQDEHRCSSADFPNWVILKGAKSNHVVFDRSLTRHGKLVITRAWTVQNRPCSSPYMVPRVG